MYKIEDIINTIILGDSLKVLLLIPDESIDLVFTDIPYNIGSESKLSFVKQKNGRIISTEEAWGNDFKDNFTDKEYLNFIEFLNNQFYRILKKEGSVILFFDRNKPFYLFPFYNKFIIRNMITFIKRDPPPHVRKNNYRSGYEQCAWFSKSEKYIFNFRDQKDMKNYYIGTIGGSKKTTHPTEKFDWMLKPIILNHSIENKSIILDPFSGSGSISIYSKILKRNYIGIEINKEFYEMSKKRLNSVKVRNEIIKNMQLEMF
ncbi:MAG: DNA-methyltransferase [Candidatus Thorarchaeota archaeon]